MNIDPALKISKENVSFIKGKPERGFDSNASQSSVKTEYNYHKREKNVVKVNLNEKVFNKNQSKGMETIYIFFKPFFEFLSKLVRMSFELINFSVKILSNISVVSFNLIKEFNFIKFGDEADTKSNQQGVRESSPPPQAINTTNNYFFGPVLFSLRGNWDHADGRRRRSYSDFPSPNSQCHCFPVFLKA